jgi:hypothetical protein
LLLYLLFTLLYFTSQFFFFTSFFTFTKNLYLLGNPGSPKTPPEFNYVNYFITHLFNLFTFIFPLTSLNK